jgi:hypothetical protein
MGTPRNFENPIKIKRNPSSKDQHMLKQAKKYEEHMLKQKKELRERKDKE